MKRGVTRSMARQAVGSELEDSKQGGDERRSHEDRLRSHRRHILWSPWTPILLGFRQLPAPFTPGYRNEGLWAVPSGGRGMWVIR